MSSPDSTPSLLGYMKLRDGKDPLVYPKIETWVKAQTTLPVMPALQVISCRKAASLLLMRLARAFQQRQTAPTLGNANEKPVVQTEEHSSIPEPYSATTTGASGASEAQTTPTTTLASTSSASATAASGETSKDVYEANPILKTFAGKQEAAVPPKNPSLKSLMQRKVKVTKNVQQAIQFVGSDLLKVLQVQQYPPTIADVVDSCLSILSTEKKIKELYVHFQTAIGTQLEDIDASMSIFFGVFTLQALQALRSQAIAAIELAYDFDFIYESCYQNEYFAKCVHVLNPNLPLQASPQFARDTEARNICWKLARLLAVKRDTVSSKTDPEGKRRRRNHVISSTASILFAATMGQAKLDLSKGQAVTDKSTTESMEPLVKKQKSDETKPTDFVDLAVLALTELGLFIARNSYNNPDFAMISAVEIRSQISKIYASIDKVKTMRDHVKGQTSIKGTLDDNSSISMSFPPATVHCLLHHYRAILHELATEAQTNLQIKSTLSDGTKPSPTQHITNTGVVRMAIANVMMLFPMVLGEPWGIHRDAPNITSKLLCKVEEKKPLLQQAASVAVVVVFQPKKSKLPSKGVVLSAEYAPQKPPPPPRPSVIVQVGAFEPPVINDSMELNEWTLSILSLSVVKPSDSLLMYLGEADRSLGDGSSCLHDVIVSVLNRGLLRVQGALRSSNARSFSLDTRLTVGRKDGQVYVSGQVDEGSHLCASVVGFYYHSLEAIIQDQMDRMEFLGSFGLLLRSESFHRALLACCYACTLKGVGTTQKLRVNGSHKDTTVHLLMETIESSPYTFLKVTEALRRALVTTGDPSKKKSGSPIVPGLPVALQKHLQKLEVQMIDSIVWATTSSSRSEGSLAMTIKTMRGLPGAWPPDVLEATLLEELADSEDVSTMLIDEKYKPPFSASTEVTFLSYVFRKLLKIAFFRIQAVCASLTLSQETQVQTQILVAFRYLLRHNFDLLYDRHIDQLILCSIYGVCRVIRVQPEVTFGKLMDAYIVVRKNDLGERACRVILRHVKLVGNENEYRPEGKVVGNLIVFYNQVYVPRMQKHFTTSVSLKRSTADYRMEHPFQAVNCSGAPMETSSVPRTGSAANSIVVVGNPASKGPVETLKENCDFKAPVIGTAAASELQKLDSGVMPEAKNATAVAPRENDVTEPGEYDLGNSAVVVAKIEGGKEVKVVEKESVGSVKPTENGTQKRMFSSMGGSNHHYS
jgi:hypothetical protein